MNTITLITTLSLSIFSLVSSTFIILRIVIPILPPHPLSRRVPPREFGLPNFRSISAVDQAHLWLALSDMVALGFFIWQIVMQSFRGSSDLDAARDTGAATRLWISMTFRQTLLLVVLGLVLLHVRMGRPVSFGKFHWMLLSPATLIWIISIAVTCILSGIGIPTLYVGIIGFSVITAILSTCAFGCLAGTLIIIRRNLTLSPEPYDTWPPKVEEKRPRPSFATDEIDALKDGSSWITSNASSHRRSLSAFSFSTYHSVNSSTHQSSHATNPITGSYPSIPPKSSFWFSPVTLAESNGHPIPPVPPLPSPYRHHTSPITAEMVDPFQREIPTPSATSQTSWLTEPTSSQETLAAWSFPTTRPGTPISIHGAPSLRDLPVSTVVHPTSSAISTAQVLGGYGYSPAPISLSNAEKALSAFSTTPSEDMNISINSLAVWLISIWLPLAFSLPFLIMASINERHAPVAAYVFLILSVTLSSPLLLCSILFRTPLPIPSGLFDAHREATSLPSPLCSSMVQMNRYKRSGSVTVVEDRRSGDVWVSNGDAVDGKSKFGRAVGLLAPKPKLSVLPIESEQPEDGEITPPLPMQTEDSISGAAYPQSEFSAELGRRDRDSRASSRFSGIDDNVALSTRIMTAQRHYSALATAVLISPSKEHFNFGFSTSTPARHHTHLRTRSTSSLNQSNKSTVSGPRSPITPPPSVPLPPTPPRRDDLQDYSFGQIDDVNEIDQLSAGLLPLLVPGLTIKRNLKAKKSSHESRSSPIHQLSDGFSSFSSPEMHSTPAREVSEFQRKRRQHLSLPSLGLGKDGVLSLKQWKEDLTTMLHQKTTGIIEDVKRNTFSGSSNFASASINRLHTVIEEEELRKTQGNRSQLCAKSPSVADKTTPIIAELPKSDPAIRSATECEVSPVTSILFTDSNGPVAESTPRDHRVGGGRALTHDIPAPVRRSSIVYIRSDKTSNSTPHRKLQEAESMKSMKSMKHPASEVARARSRQFGLLHEKDINLIHSRSAGIRPLVLAKKQKRNENENVMHHELIRSATNKARSLLRKDEVLPQVIIRPPSSGDGAIFGSNIG